jgi:quercetin dioxygenase-like cupin family protein
MRIEDSSRVRHVTGLVLGLALASGSAVVGQDRAAVVTEMKVLLDNDCVRMQFHDVAVGEKTPMHSHPRYAVYVFNTYKARITLAAGSQRMSEHKAGDAFWNEATQHVVENVGASPIHNLVLELKPGAACSAAAGSERPRAESAESAETAEITALLTSFLSPEQNPTRAAHERFWADDLVYTSSAGKVTTKAEILKSFDEAPKVEEGKTPESEPVYSAEDVLVRTYGTMDEMAALTFRLVARAADGSVQTYRNSGTFLRRGGRWQAVTWQATKEPPPAAP